MRGYYERICLHHYTCFLGERENDRERERQRERETGLSFFEDTMNIISRMICNLCVEDMIKFQIYGRNSIISLFVLRHKHLLVTYCFFSSDIQHFS